MKKKPFNLTIAATLIFSIISCESYLDVRPRSEIAAEELLETETGFSSALAGIYTLMSQQPMYGDILTMSFLDILAQRYYVPTQTSPYWGAANYLYSDASSEDGVETTIDGIWSSFYNAIVNTNNILENIDVSSEIFTENHYNLIKGEALGLRAFLHFDALRLFGPMYSDNPDALSIPYREEVSRDVSPLLPAREVVELIIRDLLEAEALLAEDPILTGESSPYYEFTPEYRVYRMNIVAVQAALARVYLYSGQTDEAFQYAITVINSGTYSFVTNADVVSVGECRDRTFRYEHLFTLMPNDMESYIPDYFETLPNTYEGSALTQLDETVEELYEYSSTDYRRQYLWERVSGKLLHSKFWQVSGNATGCGWEKSLVPVERISEMYYIAAETSPSVEVALEYLNTVRVNRGIDPLAGITSTVDLEEEITKEYQKEFFSEGQLFYYYKRKAFTAIPGTSIPGSSDVYVLPIPEGERLFVN